MSEKWESDSLSWIHEVREKNYKRARGKPLKGLSPGPSREAQALSRRSAYSGCPYDQRKDWHQSVGLDLDNFLRMVI